MSLWQVFLFFFFFKAVTEPLLSYVPPQQAFESAYPPPPLEIELIATTLCLNEWTVMDFQPKPLEFQVILALGTFARGCKDNTVSWCLM